MKWFISSDIHSFYDEWQTALKEAGFDVSNPNHGIIVCGDLLDRGEKPLECLKFTNKLHKQGRAILIKGNHEWLLEELLMKCWPEQHDIHNGTYDTLKLLCKEEWTNDVDLCKIVKKHKDLNYYLSHLVNYAEIGDNIFVHGWLPLKFEYKEYDGFKWPTSQKIDEHWQDCEPWEWEEATWYNGMFQWHEGAKLEGKTIWCGHFHASYGNSKYHGDGVEYMKKIETCWVDPATGKTEPHVNYHTFIDEGVRCLDACTVLSHFVNVEVLEV